MCWGPFLATKSGPRGPVLVAKSGPGGPLFIRDTFSLAAGPNDLLSRGNTLSLAGTVSSHGSVKSLWTPHR